MKKLIFILFVITYTNQFSQENSTFFKDKTFQLEYFLKNGVREDLVLLAGDNTLPPSINFIESEISNQLYASLGGYCNGSEATYKVGDGFLEVLERGGTTLKQCETPYEERDFFNPITGDIYMQNPANKVYYQITENEKGLWLWTNENHKLFFSQKVLSIDQNLLEKAISIYPNPSKQLVTIHVNSASVEIAEVVILDYQGREIIRRTNNFKTVDISKLVPGVYFIKMQSIKNQYITKKLVKE